MPRGALERSSQHSGFAYTTDGGRSWKHNTEGHWAMGRDGFAAATVGACARRSHLRGAGGSGSSGNGGGGAGAGEGVGGGGVGGVGASLKGMAASAASAAAGLFGAGLDAAAAAAGLDTPKSPEDCRPKDVGAQSPLRTLPFHAGALVSPAVVRLRSGAIAAFFASTAGKGGLKHCVTTHVIIFTVGVGAHG